MSQLLAIKLPREERGNGGGFLIESLFHHNGPRLSTPENGYQVLSAFPLYLSGTTGIAFSPFALYFFIITQPAVTRNGRTVKLTCRRKPEVKRGTGERRQRQSRCNA